MHRYFIKQDGYIIGSCIGKRKGYEFISKMLTLNGIKKPEYTWYVTDHRDRCDVKSRNIVYTIERQ